MGRFARFYEDKSTAVAPFLPPSKTTQKPPVKRPCFTLRKRGECGKNIWSKSGENPLKSRGCAVFTVEKAVENVKTFGGFSTFRVGRAEEFPLKSTDKKENYGGKVEKMVENPQNGEFSPKFLPKV